MTGIYMIYSNIDSTKNYIGSAANIDFRIKRHLYELLKQKHNNSKMQNYFNKHGIDNFSYAVLKECDLDSIIESEQYFIDTVKPYFNVLKKAYSLLGYKHSEDVKNKIKNKNTGRKMTCEQIRKGVIARIGQKTCKGVIRSDEYKKNLSEIKKKKVVYNGKIYDSLIELSEHLSIKYQTLYAMLRHRNTNRLNIKYYA